MYLKSYSRQLRRNILTWGVSMPTYWIWYNIPYIEESYFSYVIILIRSLALPASLCAHTCRVNHPYWLDIALKCALPREKRKPFRKVIIPRYRDRKCQPISSSHFNKPKCLFCWSARGALHGSYFDLWHPPAALENTTDRYRFLLRCHVVFPLVVLDKRPRRTRTAIACVL